MENKYRKELLMKCNFSMSTLLLIFLTVFLFTGCDSGEINSAADEGVVRQVTTASVAAGVNVTLFQEDFETWDLTGRGWTGNLNNGERWDTDTRSPHGGSMAARYDCYNNGSQGSMISPTIDLSGTENNILTFWIREKVRTWFWHDYFNHCYIQVSNDDGSTWTEIAHHTIINDYVQKSYNLDEYIMPTDRVKIRFIGQGGNADDNDKDTFIDDVAVNGVTVAPDEPEVPTRLEVLQYWAPQVYHDTRNDTTFFYRFYESQDMITKVNFDGDWYAGNNWENFPRNGDYSKMIGNAYCSFIETDTHFFLGYQYFHATDDAVIEADRHENDMEDVYICIRKGSDPSDYGTFKALISNRHGDMQKYTGSDLYFNGSHPKIFISSNGDVVNGDWDTGAHGHGIENYRPGDHNVGDDGIIYNVADVGEAPTECGGGAFSHAYDYGLVEIDELWSRRNIYNNYPFKGYGSFGADGQDAGAHAPWSNQYFQDPAAYFASNFSFLLSEGAYDYGYVHNPYYGVTESGSGSPVFTLPEEWMSTDIGSPANAGYAYGIRDTFTVTGAGNDIWGSTDQFHFTARTLTGDGEIIARVYSIQEDINAWSKAGVMIRETLNADSAFAMMVVTPKQGASFQYRTTSGGSAFHSTTGGPAAPLWVKIVRQGNSFTAFYSADGSSWIQQGGPVVINMGSTVYFGLGVTSHDVSWRCSGFFDNVSVSN